MPPILGLAQEIPQTLPESPLPGGIADVLRFFFQVPQWLQIAGAVLAVLLGVVLVVLLWRRRRGVRRWIAARPTGLQLGLAAAVALLVLVVAGFGAASWNYMQHDNDFCTGCHVMAPAFRKFTESEHAELSCHDCHRQSIFASARQLYLWVTDRPGEIGPHAPVPTRICAECHIQEDPADTWERISATAGHRVHLESDTAALAEVMCVTCHGQEVHEFVPADATCGQAGCHDPSTTRIALGRMTGQTGLHCVTCHEFTAPVAEEGEVPDGPVGLLTPGRGACFSCHEMETLLPAFDAAREPHDARCGACHNPHVQESPEAALLTCTDAGCHARPDTLTSFHRGIPEAVVEDCLSCHQLHEWTAEGEDCGACHADIAGAGTAWLPGDPPPGAARRPPGAVSRVSPPGAARGFLPAASRGAWPGVPEDGRPVAPRGHPPIGFEGGGRDPRPEAGPTLAQQRFSHGQHASVECTACHTTTGETHGQLTVRGAGDCFSCHHSEQAARTGCGSCHGPRELAGRESIPVRLRLSVWDSERSRSLPFDHAAHRGLECGTCHTAPPRLAVGKGCAECHDDHHRADSSCMTCHPTPPEDAHTARVHTAGCAGSGCHAQPTFTAMRPTRDFCLACHQGRPGPDHEPGQSCVNCHLVPTGQASRGPAALPATASPAGLRGPGPTPLPRAASSAGGRSD